MSEKFCLKWNDFQDNAVKTFSGLRAEDDFVDVTLVCDDQKQISAHKVVLSACSEYFKNILKQNKHSHPLICLTNINYDEAGLVFSRASSDIGSLLDDPPWRGPMIRLLSPIGGKSNELNSCHNTLYFVDCPQSRGTVL